MMISDWKHIADDKEKYQAYLCSREWSELREAVRKRCGGTCERCRIFPMDAVHHLTYARKYKEPVDDLQAICKYCHEFTHGKIGFDPRDSYWTIKLLLYCREHNLVPMPFDIYTGLVDPEELDEELAEAVRGAMILRAAGLILADKALRRTLPFVMPTSFLLNQVEDAAVVAFWWHELGFDREVDSKWWAFNDQGDH
jgi:hypothetical protein